MGTGCKQLVSIGCQVAFVHLVNIGCWFGFDHLLAVGCRQLVDAGCKPPAVIRCQVGSDDWRVLIGYKWWVWLSGWLPSPGVYWL